MDDLLFLFDNLKGEIDDEGYEIITNFEPQVEFIHQMYHPNGVFMSTNKDRSVWRVANYKNGIPWGEDEKKVSSQYEAWCIFGREILPVIVGVYL